MSLGEIVIKVGGIVLFVVGIALILSLVGVSFLGFSVSLSPVWAVILGVLFICGGVVLIKGGNIGL